jgi:diacylglycerol kinase family enzyme
MKVAKLVHNPTAGDEEHSKKELISLIESKGFKCVYCSIKQKGWDELNGDIDFLIAAGGDGTVRMIVKKLLKRKVIEKTLPIALLPLGTANNIANSLEISGDTEAIIDSWHAADLKPYDVGRVYEIGDAKFFLESLGYGIFATLLQELKIHDLESPAHPENAMQSAVEILHQIALAYEPHECKLEIDGANHSGKYLLVEIMNTRSIGPNLVLAPNADPGDGELDVVMIAEKHKDRFVTYLENKLAGKEDEYHYDTLKGKNITITWEGAHLHVDGDFMKIQKSHEVKIELVEGVVQFLYRRVTSSS